MQSEATASIPINVIAVLVAAICVIDRVGCILLGLESDEVPFHSVVLHE